MYHRIAQILVAVALCLCVLSVNAAYESVETGPRAKLNLIPRDGEMTFFIFDAANLCDRKKGGEKLKIKMKTQRESIFVRAGHPMNFSFSFRVIFGKKIYRDFSFTPKDGHEYSVAYSPNINGTMGFRVTEVAADGTEEDFHVDHPLKCGEEADRTYQDGPSKTVTIGKDFGDSAAKVSFIAPGLRGEFLSSTGVRLWAFSDGTCDSAEKLVLKPNDRHKAFVLEGGLDWAFRVFYNRRVFMGATSEAEVDFSFPVKERGEYVIEYLDNPFGATVNYWEIDEFGERHEFSVQPGVGCQ